MKIIIILCIILCASAARAQDLTAIAKNDPPANDAKAKVKTAKRDGAKTDAAKKPAAPAKTDAAPKTAATPTLHGALALAPEKARPVRITRFEKPPVIDGKLDDEAWKSAAAFKNFFQTSPGDNTQPSQPTEVFMGYDAKTLY